MVVFLCIASFLKLTRAPVSTGRSFAFLGHNLVCPFSDPLKRLPFAAGVSLFTPRGSAAANIDATRADDLSHFLKVVADLPAEAVEGEDQRPRQRSFCNVRRLRPVMRSTSASLPNSLAIVLDCVSSSARF